MTPSPAWVVATFYKFVYLPDCRQLRDRWEQVLRAFGVRGTLLVAREGINSTLAGSAQAIEQSLSYLRQDARLAGLVSKQSTAHDMPFLRLKVLCKPEIVTMGLSSVAPDQRVGQYVDAEDWNRLIRLPDVLLIDTRNDYEVAIGSFAGAVNPRLRSFRQFPDYVRRHFQPSRQPRVAMFCTGGIRCEKASAFMLAEGYPQVYHLRGGILSYLEKIPASQSLWQGDCFVFDQRVAVTQDLKQAPYDVCRGCRRPLTESDKQLPQFEAGVTCSHCYSTKTPESQARARQRYKQVTLAARRALPHLGPEAQSPPR